MSSGDSEFGVVEMVFLVIGGSAVILGFLTPFVDKLNTFYKSILSTFTNYFAIILISILFIIPIFVFFYHRILVKRTWRKAREKEEEKKYHEKQWLEQQRIKRENDIDDAHRHSQWEKARQLLKEKYLEEKNVDELVKMEIPNYLAKQKAEQEPEEDDEDEEQINIKVDLDNPFYKRKDLNKHEISFLIDEGYKVVNYKSVCTGKKENFIVKPRFNESAMHLVVIYDLAEYLKSRNVGHGIYMTRMPDIVMYFGENKIALEVETGTVMSNMKKFREKLLLLEENYGKDWYFIVTNRNKVKKYKNYGKVIDPRYIKGQIDKIIEKYQK